MRGSRLGISDDREGGAEQRQRPDGVHLVESGVGVVVDLPAVVGLLGEEPAPRFGAVGRKIDVDEWSTAR